MRLCGLALPVSKNGDGPCLQAGSGWRVSFANLSDRQASLVNESSRLRVDREQFLASNLALEAKSAEVREAIVSAEANVTGWCQNETELRERNWPRWMKN